MPGPHETRKDLVQEAVESGATHVGRIATIVTGAVRDVARELGSFATDLFEMREASRRALRDHEAEGQDHAARLDAAGDDRADLAAASGPVDVGPATRPADVRDDATSPANRS